LKVLKYILVAVFVVVLLFLFVANFSAVESRFQCSGAVSLNGASSASTVYLKLQRYRWWVGLWSDSDGNILLEIPNVAIQYFGEIIELGEQIQIYSFEKHLRGNFSLLSSVLALETSGGFFDGKCTRISSD